MYSAIVKTTDITLDSEIIDLSKDGQNILPPPEVTEEVRKNAAKILTDLLLNWFTTPLTAEQIEKRLKIEFQPFQYQLENKWVNVRWVPKYFQVQKKGFFLLFQVQSFIEASPRIPMSFLEATTPRATTPTEEKMPQMRNILIQPSVALDLAEMIPYAEHQSSLELRDEHTRDRQRLRQARLKAAIARLKVEEMKERYLRHYGKNGAEESSESEQDSASELSDADSKK
jgi:rRNA maturation endonuclease Nob1